MKELAKHIEILLQDNDCVIVPQLGGFVAQTLATSWVEEEQLFLPPLRTIGFNAKLQADDGLLIRSLMQTYGFNKAEAIDRISGSVMRLRQELLENGTCDLEGIGLMTQADNGEIQFSPCQAGIPVPEYYGLDAFSFPLLAAESAESEVQPAATREKNDDVLVVHVDLRWLRGIAVAIAAVVLFVLFSPEAQNTTSSEEQLMAARTFLPVFPQVAPLSVTAASEIVQDAPHVSAVSDVSSNMLPMPAATEEQMVSVPADLNENGDEDVASSSQKQAKYCVVLASQITERNASRFVEELNRRGLDHIEVLKTSSMVRVVCSGLQSEPEAYQTMKRIKKQYADLHSAWVMKLTE